MNKNMTLGTSGSVSAPMKISMAGSVQTVSEFLNMSSNSPQLSTSPGMTQLSYHEMAEVPVREVDALEQLDRNVHMLSELRTRLQFMNREIRYLMKI